jgi:formylmethanofuran--tetrahydromethanopterin N-formyltransferase
MKINNVEIEETFAEGFSMYACRILITAENKELARIAAGNVTGFATSTIDCPCEASIDQEIEDGKTPDHRPGISVMFCFIKKENADKVMLDRIGQCVLTTATTSCFNWFAEDARSEKTFEINTGYKLKFFGDGFEVKDQILFNGQQLTVWKIPVMDGYFIVQDKFTVTKIAGGGNLMIFFNNLNDALSISKAVVQKIKTIEGLTLPFPGGFVRSPSKIGSLKYSKFLNASTNEPLLPILMNKINYTRVPEGALAGYEFVINGFTEERVKKAMRLGILEATQHLGVIKITAGNYEGKLGKIRYDLKEILS